MAGCSRKKLSPKGGELNYFRSCFSEFPEDVFWAILKHISPLEVRGSLMLVSKQWYQVLTLPALWRMLSDIYGMFPCLRFTNTVTDRRSRGRIRQATMIGTDLEIAVRSVNLSEANAGFDDGVPASVLRETDLMMKLNHPNVLRCYGAEFYGNCVHVMSEYVGLNLGEWTHIHKKFDKASLKRAVIAILRQLLSGLQYLHDQSIMHRNIKPDNIFLVMSPKHPAQQLENGDFTLKIGDFAMGRIEGYTDGCYTPENPKERERSRREQTRLHYKSPEILLRYREYGAEVDMWSVGCLWMELVLNEKPFKSAVEFVQLVETFKVTGTPPKSLWPEMAGQSASLVLKLFPQYLPLNWKIIAEIAERGLPEAQDMYQQYLTSCQRTGQEATASLMVDFANIMGAPSIKLLGRLLCVPGRSRFCCRDLLHDDLFDLKVRPPQTPLQRVLQMHDDIYKHELRLLSPVVNPSVSTGVDYMMALFNIQNHFKLRDETLHLAVDMSERFVQRCNSRPPDIHHLAISCLKIADVYNEVSREYYASETVTEYNSFGVSSAALREWERKVLLGLKFVVAQPTLRWLVDAYLAIAGYSKKSRKMAIASFIADLVVVSFPYNYFPRTLQAQVIMLLAVRCIDSGDKPKSADQPDDYDLGLFLLHREMLCRYNDARRLLECVAALRDLLNNKWPSILAHSSQEYSPLIEKHRRRGVHSIPFIPPLGLSTLCYLLPQTQRVRVSTWLQNYGREK